MDSAKEKKNEFSATRIGNEKKNVFNIYEWLEML